MKSKSVAAIAAVGILFGMGTAFADMGKAEGDILVNSKGMTLYTFDNDKDGVSACYDDCATNWPPLIADADAKAEGDWSLGERKDGAKQWAYKKMPLYLWVGDSKAGDMTGDGVGDVWHTAKK